MIAKAKIPAVAYIRMNSDRQEASPQQQRNEIESYAQQHGYRINSWYIDEAISGSRSDRKDFQRLIADAKNGTFRVVLCWDQDRFSRFPPLEANHYWYLLDTTGVHIATVAQGRLNFDDLGEWLKASVVQHGKAQFLKDLSRNVKRGQRAAASRGDWTGGSAPRGFIVVNRR
jgi:DNA invertase Pin-like site-specific DNA recombinase